MASARNSSAISNAGILSMPVEILEEILARCSSSRDIWALCATCKDFHPFAHASSFWEVLLKVRFGIELDDRFLLPHPLGFYSAARQFRRHELSQEWHKKDAAIRMTSMKHTGPVVSVRITRDRVVSGSVDESVRIWNANSGERLGKARKLGPIQCVDIHGAELECIAVAARQQGALLLDGSTLNLISSQAPCYQVYSVGWVNPQTVLVGGRRYLGIFDVRSWNRPVKLGGLSVSDVKSVSVCGDWAGFASTNSFSLLDLRVTDVPLHIQKLPATTGQCHIHVHSDTAAVTTGRSVSLFDFTTTITTPACRYYGETEMNSVWHDSSMVAATNTSGALLAWERDSQATLFRRPVHDGDAWCVTFDQSRMVTCGQDGTVKILRVGREPVDGGMQCRLEKPLAPSRKCTVM